MPDERALESFGSWLRQRRKALDLTQAAVAHCVGCAEVTIRKLEAEVARPSRQIAQRLATCLEIPPAEHDLFLQIARGERPVERLPLALIHHDSAPQTDPQVPLAPLPLDVVPPPAPLPAGSRMPLRRNPLFVGRDADLRQLARALTVSETAAIGQVEVAAATGLGGIGKTQLACEFVHRYGHYFPGGVFWLSFANSAAVPAEVAACGGVDGMHLSAEFDTLPLEQQVRLVLTAWKEPLPRLLVFDNCEDEALLAQWQPPHGGCRVLLTSRRRHWNITLGVQAVPLDVLPRADSLALLRTFRPDLPADDADLDAIAEILGDLPLALHLAGSFLARYRHAIMPAQYLERLSVPTILDDRSLREAGLSPTKHVQHVARTFEQSYARLDAADPTDALARTLLAHAASFAPGESLPRWLLLRTRDLPEDDAERALLAEDALMRLIDLGLLETDAAGTLRMHRLLIAFVHAVLETDVAQAVVEATMLRVAEDVNERGNPRPLLVVQPHLRFLTESAQRRADARAAALGTALGYHLWHLGVYREAQGYHARALAIRQQVLGPDHPDTATSLNNLGLVFLRQGQYAECQGYFAQALAIRQQVLGADHPETASSLNNVGLALHNRGQYEEARRYLEQALAIRQCVQGDVHPDTATTLNNLGLLCHELGQYAAAQDYYEQALTIRQQVLGANDLQTAMSLNNLGGIFYIQGQYRESQGYLEQALAIQQRVVGEDHPDTAMSLGNLGELLTAEGRYAEAQGYFEQALAIFQRMLGPEHPYTVHCLNHLGGVLAAQGQYGEAQYYHEQALAIRQRVLGDDHPQMAESLSSLGDLLQVRGRSAEAQRYYAQALAIQEQVLGPDHPTTAKSLRGLGAVLHAQGATMEARCYLERAWTIFVERLGPQHPDTERTRHLLACLDANDIATERESGG